MPDTPPTNDSSTKNSLWLALKLAWDLGYIIAIPAVLFGFGGAWLDKQLGTSPLCILAGFLLAVTISGYSVYRRIKEMKL